MSSMKKMIFSNNLMHGEKKCLWFAVNMRQKHTKNSWRGLIISPAKAVLCDFQAESLNSVTASEFRGSQ